MTQRKLGAIMHSPALAVAAASDVEIALRMMEEHKISCLVVERDGVTCGIVTEKDVVRCYGDIARGHRRIVADIMTAAVLTVPETMDHLEAFHFMTERHIRHLLVADAAGKVVGIVTETDYVHDLDRDYFERLKDVESVMAPVVTVGPTATLAEALGHLSQSEITCIVATGSDGALGILTERDTVHLLRDGKVPDITRVVDVMTAPVATARSRSTLLEASQRLAALKIRRLVVVDDGGVAVGVVGQHEIVKGLESEYVKYLEGVVREKNQALAEVRQAKQALDDQAAVLREALDKLADAHAELTEFTSVAAHDLQEPIRLVVTNSQLLGREYGEAVGGNGARYLAHIIDGAKRMRQSVRDLVAYSMASSHQDPLDAIDAGEVARTVISMLDRTIAETDGRVELTGLPTVKARRSVLVEVFCGLIANALTFRRPGIAPVVRVTATDDGDAWRFQVADNGIGMEEQYLVRIFGLFEKLHPTADYGGSGVGLAICRRLIERQGGRIWAESQVGQGSVFSFTVPK